MPSGLKKITALTGALALALSLASTAPAYAQIGGIDTSSLGLDEVETIGSVVDSVGVGSVLGSLGPLGSSNFPLDGAGSSEELREAPRSQLDSIDQAKFVELEYQSGEYEYWLVHSAEMKREVILEVVPTRQDEGPAPVLYMLDGVGAPEYDSGWNHQAGIADRVKDDNVHVVMPTGAYASYYADWEKEDPVLGYNKWETFLTDELPGIVQEGLAARGHVAATNKAAIGGISMGGQAAMHLAATYPNLYQGVMSFSGNYSTEGELAYQSVRGAIERLGGNIENMWGPRGSDSWKRHDTISHVEGLKNTAVYFSAGNTAIGPDDIAHYKSDYFSMLLGLLLEAGVLESSQAFERELNSKGIEHRVDYAETGFHSWHTFLKNFGPGWDYIKPALYSDDVEPGTGSPGSSGSLGSSGSSGSTGSSTGS